MTTRLFAALLALAVAPLTARAADDEHPYKNAKVGDFATYKIAVKAAGQDISGTATSTVTEKTEKEVTIKTTGKVGPRELPGGEQKIDLTKPFDPTKGGLGGGNKDSKIEKLKDGTEKVKVGEKEYETTWTTYKVTGKAMNQDVEGEAKVWIAKDVTGGVVKMVSTAKLGPIEIKTTMELEKTGNNKDK